MSFSGVLVLKGNLKIGPVAGSLVDVSEQVTGYTIMASRDTVQVPATLSGPKSARAGGVQYQLKVDYFASDGSASDDLLRVFWATFGTADGQLAFSANTEDGATSATNPLWSGTFIVTGAQLGGAAEGLSTDSQTFPMTGAPTIATS